MVLETGDVSAESDDPVFRQGEHHHHHNDNQTEHRLPLAAIAFILGKGRFWRRAAFAGNHEGICEKRLIDKIDGIPVSFKIPE